MFTLPTIVLPIWLLLIPYTIMVFIFLLYAFFNIYALLRFAAYSFESYFVTTLFVGGAIILLAISYQYLAAFDWTVTWTFRDFLQTKPL